MVTKSEWIDQETADFRAAYEYPTVEPDPNTSTWAFQLGHDAGTPNVFGEVLSVADANKLRDAVGIVAGRGYDDGLAGIDNLNPDLSGLGTETIRTNDAVLGMDIQTHLAGVYRESWGFGFAQRGEPEPPDEDTAAVSSIETAYAASVAGNFDRGVEDASYGTPAQKDAAYMWGYRAKINGVRDGGDLEQMHADCVKFASQGWEDGNARRPEALTIPVQRLPSDLYGIEVSAATQVYHEAYAAGASQPQQTTPSVSSRSRRGVVGGIVGGLLGVGVASVVGARAGTTIGAGLGGAALGALLGAVTSVDDKASGTSGVAYAAPMR